MISTSTRSTLCAALGLALGFAVASSVALAEETQKARAASANNVNIIAADILSRWASVAESAGKNMAVWQEQFGIQLGMMSPNSLRSLERVQVKGDSDARTNYAQFEQAFRSALMSDYAEKTASKVNLKLGSATSDQIFIPTVPCRVVDTRNVGGPLGAGAARNFNFYAAVGTFNWANQGGPNGNASSTCPGTVTPNGGAPSAAVLTVTVVSPSSAGNFVGWGGASPVPLTSILNWNSPGDIAANTTTIPAGGRTGTGPGGAIADFAIFYNGSSGVAQVVVDVVGYFVENKATALDCLDQTEATGTGSANLNVFPAACATGYTQTSTLCRTSSFNFVIVAYDDGFCAFHALDGLTTYTGFASRKCCRVPGLP
ncbi:MAG TPA: hypothetical protein VGK44_07925 [Casimicrobiaceae bacterium]|jgi:hypothetical protein